MEYKQGEEFAHQILKNKDDEYVQSLIDEGKVSEKEAYYLGLLIGMRRSLANVMDSNVEGQKEDLVRLVKKAKFTQESESEVLGATNDFYRTIKESDHAILETDLLMGGMLTGVLFVSKNLREKYPDENVMVKIGDVREINKKSMERVDVLLKIAKERVPIFPEQVLERLEVSSDAAPLDKKES